MLPDFDFAELSLRESVQRLLALVSGGGRHYACFCEANLFVNAWRFADVSEALRKADVVFADGVSVLMLARLRGHAVPKRISGPMLMPELCEHGVSLGLRHFFLGGRPGVPERLAANLVRRFPGLLVAGTLSPPFGKFSEADETRIREAVEAAKPDILWVGLGAPRQELWMAAQQGRLLAPLMLGVGAAFDFHSGKRRWAPLWIRKLGMEWAFRMVTGGPRTFVRNVRCVSLMSVALLIALVSPRRRGSAG